MTRTRYPNLNEKLVKKLQKLYSYNPQWFDMDQWGVVDQGYCSRDTVKIPGVEALARDHLEPNYCETSMCMAGSACLIDKSAAWYGDVNGKRQKLRPGKVKATGITLELFGKGITDHREWVAAGAASLGIDESLAWKLFYTEQWPDWVGFEGEDDDAKCAVLLLQALLDDQDFFNPDAKWLKANIK